MVNRLVKAAGFAGSAYFLQSYVSERIRDANNAVKSKRTATEILRKRFTQNQEAVLYTVMILLPSLSDQILSTMDIHALTRNLKSLNTSSQPQSLAGSIISDAGSDVASSTYDSVGSSTPSEAVSASLPIPSSNLDTLSGPSSLISPSSSLLEPSSQSFELLSPVTPPRTKAELWNEIKMLTITRTLTTIYAVSIFTLLTTIQLTMLARLKYVASVRQAEREERVKEMLDARLSLSNILFAGFPSIDSLASGDLDNVEESHLDLTDEAEQKFLTMSWWMLHVGWRDISERVRRAVEEVFDAVSVKAKLAAIDMHRLFHDVRRRVEHEITFEGREKRADLFSTILPPTQETLQLVLNQSGFASSSKPEGDHPLAFGFEVPSLQTQSNEREQTMFNNLFDETRRWIMSSDFAIVLESCLDRASEIFFENMDQNIFTSPSTPLSHPDPPRIPLASSLPGLARWSELALTGLPNELVERLLDVPQVSIFQAIIWGEIQSLPA